MPVIPFFNESTPDKSADSSIAAVINMYLVANQDQNKYQASAYPTPGATLFSSGSAQLRALYTEHNITYGVDGNSFFSVNAAGTRTPIGTLNTSSGFVKIKGIAQELIIIDGTNGYYYNIATNTFGTITDVNFPSNAIDVECQDEFALVLERNSQEWQASAISDVTTWPALSFASTTGNQNYNVALISVHREIFLFGTQTTEVWDNVGTINFTFGRNTNVYIEYGCAATQSVIKARNTVYFLGQSPSGGPVVVMFNGYAPVIISTDAINYQLSTYATISDAIAINYQQEGHEFYVLTFPTAGTTWVYDMNTQMWHQRQSLISGNQTRWLANCYTYNYNKCLVGDTSTGNIYQLDMTNFTENGSAITRTLITHPFYQSGAWVFCDKLQVDFDTAAGSNLSNWNLYVSRDGGKTFGSAKPAVPQNTGYGYRVYWTRLGIAKSWVFKLQTSMNAQPIILGAWANIRMGGPE